MGKGRLPARSDYRGLVPGPEQIQPVNDNPNARGSAPDCEPVGIAGLRLNPTLARFVAVLCFIVPGRDNTVGDTSY